MDSSKPESLYFLCICYLAKNLHLVDFTRLPDSVRNDLMERIKDDKWFPGCQVGIYELAELSDSCDVNVKMVELCKENGYPQYVSEYEDGNEWIHQIYFEHDMSLSIIYHLYPAFCTTSGCNNSCRVFIVDNDYQGMMDIFIREKLVQFIYKINRVLFEDS